VSPQIVKRPLRRLPSALLALKGSTALRLAVAGALLAGLAALVSVWGGPAEPPRAAIVDQLSLTYPNTQFVEAASEMLVDAGYEVDYYSGESVTVDFYRDLGTHGYDIVLVRAHAGRRVSIAEGPTADLFSSERYIASKHVREQQEGSLKVGSYSEDAEPGELLFTIPAQFVSSEMRGRFDGATVVLMGCDVLAGQTLAQAFVDRGAGSVVGWDSSVTAAHTDATTLRLLQGVLRERLSVQRAAVAAMAELGPDPFYQARLVAYPPEG
jgi:hypothetical protein